MTIVSTNPDVARHLPVASPDKPLKVYQASEELSVLKANEEDAIELFHSDDPHEREQGEAILAAIVEREGDLVTGCNKLFAAAAHLTVEAGACKGKIEMLQAQIDQIKSQEIRLMRKASQLRVYGCMELNRHFPGRKTHPTPWGNIGMVPDRKTLVTERNTELRPTHIPEDYEFLIKKVEKTSVEKVIDKDRIREILDKGESLPFVKYKEPATRFY